MLFLFNAATFVISWSFSRNPFFATLLDVDGLLVENRNQAEESSGDHCPLERGKEGIP